MATPSGTRHGLSRPPWRGLLATATVLAAVALQPAAASALPSPTRTPAAVVAYAAASKPKQHATFGIGPARGGKLDPSRPYFNIVATPGVHVLDHVVITNYAKSPLTVAVYATDAVNASDGSFALLGQGIRPTGAGTWIVVRTPQGSGRVTVPARSSTVLPVRITIPAGAVPGDHAAGVIASLSTVSKNAEGANVRLLQRVGTRFFIRVSGQLRPQLTIERLAAHYVTNMNPVGTGRAVVTYRVHNTGNVKLGAHQMVSVRGLFGTTGRSTPPDVPLLLPGGHLDVRVHVGGVVPEVWMTAKVQLSPIVLAGDSDVGVHKWSATTNFWAVPWLLLAILIMLGALGWWSWRRHRNRVAGTSTAASVPDQGRGQLVGRHRG